MSLYDEFVELKEDLKLGERQCDEDRKIVMRQCEEDRKSTRAARGRVALRCTLGLCCAYAAERRPSRIAVVIVSKSRRRTIAP